MIAAVLLLAHGCVVTFFGTAAFGPLLSDLLQLSLGGLVLLACFRASVRSEGLACSVWRLASVAYVLWLLAQGLSVFIDVTHGIDMSHGTFVASWVSNMLFCFWFAPMAMAMFLDPEQEDGPLASLVSLDFVQGPLVCIAAYLYFFYLPKSENPGELAHSVWAPYFVGYGFVVAAFILRATVTPSRHCRA